MNRFLNDIRSAEDPISVNRKIINTIAVLSLGITLGTFSKYLDFRQARLSGSQAKQKTDAIAEEEVTDEEKY